MSNYLIDGEKDQPIFIFAHGAGAGSDSEFMQTMGSRYVEYTLNNNTFMNKIHNFKYSLRLVKLCFITYTKRESNIFVHYYCHLI